MNTRPRNHSIPVQNRANTRQEKCRKPTNYYPPTTTLPPPTSKIQTQEQTDYNATEARYATDSRNYVADSPTDADERTSNESLSAGDTSANPDGNMDAEHQYRDIAADIKREKLMQDVTYSSYPSNKRMANYHADNYDEIMRSTHTSQRRSQDYAEKKTIYDVSNDPVTMRKMQKLRELQRRRDMADKFYSHEIRRLIGDQYDKNATMGRSSHHHDKAFTGDRVSSSLVDSLEQCGTMMTITRLDCGCAEKVIRPIFTTPSGRTQRRNCAQDQQVRMNMSAPNARFVHAVPSPRLESKSFGEQRSAGLEQQQQQQQQRVGSPRRKISESSVNSI